MPTFGRTASGKWHVVGPDGCRYGRAFGDAGDRTPAETVTATDVVAYQPPDDAIDSGSGGPGDAPTTGLIGRGPTDEQRLVFPRALRESDRELCRSCLATLETQQKRRSRCIGTIKRATPLRNVDWDRQTSESLQSCYWCRAHERELWVDEDLDARVCPPCGRLFDSPLGDPSADEVPETDRRPETSADPVTPVVLGVDLPDYDATDLVGVNRPVIELRSGNKYATLKLSLAPTGHAFTPSGIEALDAVRSAYAERVRDDQAHQTDVTMRVGDPTRSVTLEGVYPDDGAWIIGECRAVVSDPRHWFRLGWDRYGDEYTRRTDQSIPGSDPVVEAYPRLRTQSPAASVDTEHLRSLTDPGRYQRGERYYERGAVTAIERVDELLQATVQGSQPYDVRVTLEDGRFVRGRCSCPDDAVPCKHVVAAVLASGDVETVGGDRSLSALVEAASADEVRALLLDAAEDDAELRRRIYDELGE